MYLRKQAEFLLQPSFEQLKLENVALEPAAARPMFKTEKDFDDWKQEKATYDTTLKNYDAGTRFHLN